MPRKTIGKCKMCDYIRYINTSNICKKCNMGNKDELEKKV